MSTIATTPAHIGLRPPGSDAARRLYEAEVALHAARQAGLDAWIAAAADRLHEAVIGYLAAASHDGAVRAL